MYTPLPANAAPPARLSPSLKGSKAYAKGSASIFIDAAVQTIACLLMNAGAFGSSAKGSSRVCARFSKAARGRPDKPALSFGMTLAGQKSMKKLHSKPRPKMTWWLLPAVLFINLAALGLLMIYSSLNLRPYTPPHDLSQSQTWRQTTLLMTSLLPTAASLFYLWPIFAWLRGLTTKEQNRAMTQPPLVVVEKAANARSEERRVGKECRSRW